jgi:hypothetical protein
MDDVQALRAEAHRFIRLTQWAWDDDVRQKLRELGRELESDALKLERIRAKAARTSSRRSVKSDCQAS